MNARKGYSYTGKNACNASPDPDTARFMGLPQDTCFASTCPTVVFPAPSGPIKMMVEFIQSALGETACGALEYTILRAGSQISA